MKKLLLSFLGITYADSIENCTLEQFFKCNKTHDYRHLMNTKNPLLQQLVGFNILYDAWDEIYKEFIAFYGLSDEYKDYLRMLIEANEQWYNFYIHKDRNARTMARLADEQIQKHQKLFRTSTSEDLINTVSLKYGYEIDPKTQTVKQFYSKLKGLEKQHKKALSNVRGQN